jgi:tetratricopeptide (TPR) repeat protein
VWANIADLEGELGLARESAVDYRRAITLTRGRIAAKPEDAGGWQLLRALRREVGDQGGVRAAFEGELVARPDDLRLMLEAAEYHLTGPGNPQRDPGRGRELALRAALADPVNTPSVAAAAPLLLAAGDEESFRRLAERYLEQKAGSDDPADARLLAAAYTWLPSADPGGREAVRYAERVAAGDTDPWTRHALGMAYLRAGRLREADRLFTEAIEAEPRWTSAPLARLGRGLVAAREGRRGAAARHLSEATRSLEDPEYAAAMYWTDRPLALILRRELESLLTPVPAPRPTQASQ